MRYRGTVTPSALPWEFIGPGTTILRLGPFTLLTDPTFLHQGDRAHVGKGMFAVFVGPHGATGENRLSSKSAGDDDPTGSAPRFWEEVSHDPSVLAACAPAQGLPSRGRRNRHQSSCRRNGVLAGTLAAAG